MATLKKISPAWAPVENPTLKVGETQEVTDYVALVRQGFAVLVDEAGNELPLPNQVLTCPVCYQQIPGTLADFTKHVEEKHASATKAKVVEPKTPEPVTTETQKVVEPVATEQPKIQATKTKKV